MKLNHHNTKTGSRYELLVSDRNILDALAYAVEAGIPPETMLEALEQSAARNLWWRFYLWSSLGHSIQMLRAGAPISAVLKARPLPYYLSNAVACAERNGNLPAVLPVLARNLHLQRCFAGNTFAVLSANIIVWLTILLLLNGLMIFIYPNMEKLFIEYTGAEKVFYLAGTGIRWPELLQFLSWFPLLIVLSMVLFVCSMNARFLEGLYLPLPFFGSMIKRKILYDLSGMFYCLLASGMDIGTAAHAAAVSEPRFWMRRRLKKFAAAVDAGENWYPAWQREIRLSTPMADWILHSGAVSGNLAESFQQLQGILAEENQGSNYRLNVCLKVAITLINAVLVGAIGFSFFYLLIDMILKL